MSNKLKGKPGPNKGREFSEEWLKNLVVLYENRLGFWKSKKLSEDHRRKLSIAAKVRCARVKATKLTKEV